MGIFDWAYDKPKEEVKPQESQQLSQPAPSAYQFSPTSSTINTEIYSALNTNINNAVTPNNLSKLLEMAETMKSAIVDEGTRIKASAAALKLPTADVNTTIDSILEALTKEEAEFNSTVIAQMGQEFEGINTSITNTNSQIDELVAKLNAATAQRDELVGQANMKQDEKTNLAASFVSTKNQVIAELESNRKKIQIYLPQGVV